MYGSGRKEGAFVLLEEQSPAKGARRTRGRGGEGEISRHLLPLGAPAARELAWKAITANAPCGAGRRWLPGVEAWQCVCPLCGDAEDTVEHRMEACVLAREAWQWTTQVLVVVGLGYTSGSMAFWLYGGSKQIQDEQVVTTL